MATNERTGHQWTNPTLGWFFALFSAIGLFASFQLLLSEITLLSNPEADLGCDLNPLIGCSSSLLTPQSHLLGIPNSGVGMFLFGMVLALAAVLIAKGSLPHLVWWGMSAGTVAGVGYVVYFLFQSIFVFGALCPYCMVIWFAVIGLLPLVWGGALASGAFGRERRASGATVLKYSWAIIIALTLIVVLAIVVGMSDKLGMLLA